MKNKIQNSKTSGTRFLLRNSGIVLYLLMITLSAHAQNVNKAEYFFDTDPGFGHATQVTLTLSADSTWQLPSISTSALSKGYHQLYIRTKDSNKRWGQTTRLNIEIIANATQVMDTIIIAEYFIDTDPKFGKGKKIILTSPDSNITKQFTIPASELTNKSIGYHTIYGRVRDNLGRWSETFSNRIELLKNENQTSVAKIEFFFVGQNDDGFGLNHSKTFTPVFVDSTVTFNIPYNQLQFHQDDTLFLRVRDNINNRWSHTAKLTGLNISVVGPRLAETIEDNSYSIYPNPATDHISIEFKQDISESIQFFLTDMIGKIVHEQIINDRSARINLDHPSGIYFVNLKNSKGILTKKIILQ